MRLWLDAPQTRPFGFEDVTSREFGTLENILRLSLSVVVRPTWVVFLIVYERLEQRVLPQVEVTSLRCLGQAVSRHRHHVIFITTGVVDTLRLVIDSQLLLTVLRRVVKCVKLVVLLLDLGLLCLRDECFLRLDRNLPDLRV